MNWGTVIGPDVSFYQDAANTPQQIDFDQMKRAGADFVIIRAGQNTWTDPDFHYNWLAAKAAGLPRGAYWFYDSRVSPISQVKLFISLLANDPPECGSWPDLEETYRGPYQGWNNWILFLDYLRMNLPRVGIYTAPSYWSDYRDGRVVKETTKDGKKIYFPKMTADALAYFKRYELWIAHYNVSQPSIPLPWTSAVFWQYGTPKLGKQFGAESIEIDMNYFNGDKQTFSNYFDLTETLPPSDGTIPPIVPTDETGAITMYSGKTNQNPTKIFDQPNGQQIDQLPVYTVVQGAAPSNLWVHITQPKAGYVKLAHLTGYAPVVVPPPPPPDTGPVLKHTIKVYSDGSIDVDGVPAN
jgi:GH25 family lysozyme M1 (1,4-beta-N-acetylmuramidase)